MTALSHESGACDRDHRNQNSDLSSVLLHEDSLKVQGRGKLRTSAENSILICDEQKSNKWVMIDGYDRLFTHMYLVVYMYLASRCGKNVALCLCHVGEIRE